MMWLMNEVRVRTRDGVFDKKGNLWLGGDGVTSFDPISASIKSNVADPLGCSASQGASFQASDGQIFLGDESGYCAFYPPKRDGKKSAASAGIQRFSSAQ